MSLEVLQGKKPTGIQEKIIRVVQGVPQDLTQINVALKDGWQISEIISLSGCSDLPGEIHYLVYKD